MKYEEIFEEDKKKRPQHFRYLLHKDKNIMGPFLDNYLNNINHNNYISDALKPVESNKINVLFSGCSITVGCGLNNIKESWSYKLYEHINSKNHCSGYFNVGCSGASPIEIMINVLKYIAKYGCPDFIFILFSNWGRDWYKFNTFHGSKEIENGEIVDIFIFNLYSILEDICKKNNAKLFSTSWVDFVPGITDYIDFGVMKDFEGYMNNAMLNSFDSYYEVDKKRFAQNVYSYIQNSDNDMTIIGTDGSHPSEATHYAWFQEAKIQLERYRDDYSWNK